LKSSIRNQLITLLLLSIIVPMAATAAITIFYIRGEIRERVVEENTKLIYQGKKNLTNYMESFDRISANLYNNTGIYNVLSQGVNSYEQDSVIHAGLQSLSRAVEGIYQVFLHVNTNNESYLLTGGTFKRGVTLPQPWTDNVKPYSAFIEPTHLSHDYGIRMAPYLPKEQVITFHRPIYQVPSKKQIGSLSIDIKLDEIASLGEQLYEHEKEKLFLFDENGIVVYASDPEQIGQPISEPWGRQLMASTADSGILERDDSGFAGIMIYDKIKEPYLNLTLVKQIPNHYLYESTRHLSQVNMLIALILLIAAAAVSVAMSLRITNPIKQLIRHINKIQVGQLNEPLKIERQDEIGIMAKRFQTMMDTINDLFLQKYKLKLANKTSQFHMLQAQINPHFMNNALQSIGTLALQHQDIQVYKLISSLGQMMHYSMDTKETIIPFSKELSHLSHYLELQKQRFEGNFEYRIAAEPSVESIMIPKMILQPIVENYFKHGFVSQKNGRLLVEATLRDGEVKIVIQDNGSGMDAQRLHELQQELALPPSADDSTVEGIGLINVMARLNLYYGNQAAMELANLEPHGVCVTLTIPDALKVSS